MSLNGLDAPAIAQVAEAVQQDSAGWFLLKYATRDEIELYGTGSGGLAEASAKVAEYQEKSPLYGIITHEEKKALIRFVPTGTSRLLQARVKIHFDAISSQFPHSTELSVSDANELTPEALGAASPTPAAAALPISPALSPTSQLPPRVSTSDNAPSRSGWSSTHDSSVNGDVAVKSDDGSDTPSSRTARLLADVRAGKLESHEVLAALRITPSRESDRRPSENSLEKPEQLASQVRSGEADAKRAGSAASSEPQLTQLPSPRRSIGSASNADLYRAKLKVGPRPSHSTDSSVSANVASLPAGVSMPKQPPPAPSQSPPPTVPTDSPASPTGSTPFGPGDNTMRPIVQAPASVTSGTHTGKPGSTAATVMTLPANLGQRKGSGSSLQSPRDQQTVEKMRLMKALEMQKKKKQAKNKGDDDTTSAEPSPMFPGSTSSPTSTAQNAIDAALEKAGEHESFPPLTEIDTATANSLHAATKSSPTLGSMVNFPLRAPDEVLASALQSQSRRGEEVPVVMSIPQLPESQAPRDGPESALHLPDLTASGPATLRIESPDDKSKEPSSVDAAAIAAMAETQTPAKTLAPLNTTITSEPTSDENQRTPVAAVRNGDQTLDMRPERESVKPQISRMHSNNVSISTSISGASSFLEELETSNLQQAQPITMMKSPVTPNFPRSPGIPKTPPFAPVESKLDAVESSPVVVEPLPQPATAEVPAPIDVVATKEAPAELVDTPTMRANEPWVSEDMEFQPVSNETGKDPKAKTEESKLPAPEPVKAVDKPPGNDTEADPLTLDPQAAAIVLGEDVQPKGQVANDAEPPKPTMPSVGAPGEDPMKAIIEAEMGATPQPSNPLSGGTSKETTDLPPPNEETGDLSIPKGGSPGTRKHPTVQPPQIWGGALRSASNPSSEPPRHLSPVPDLSKLTRSASVASDTGSMLRPDSPSGVKKTSVGSRIADRIKALEKSSNSAAASSAPVYAGSVVSVSSRKSSFHTPPGSSGTDARRIGGSSSPNSNIFTRRFGTVHGTAESGRTTRPGSSASPESGREPLGRISTDPAPRPAYVRQKSSDSQMLPPSRDGGASTISQQKSKSSFSSWTGRRDSAETNRTGHSRQSSVESTGTNSDKKKENKAKKLMKRMSGAFSPRKERSSPNFSEPIIEGNEPEPPPPSTSHTTTTIASSYAQRPATRDGASSAASKTHAHSSTRSTNSIVVGEVNVQFPDTLLWKRRHVELDGDGYIILAASTLEKRSRVAVKKFHMSEFRQPYIPDQEREELPYSIILDFEDSSTLQCACQNGVDQKNVLQALVQFYARHGQGKA